MLAVLGGSLAFDGLGILTNYLIPWYRFFLITVPLDVLLVGCVLSTAPSRSVASSNVRGTPGTWRRAPLQTITAVLFVIVVIGSSIPASAIGMFSTNVHGNEAQELGGLLLAHPDEQARQYEHLYSHILSIDAYIDRMSP